MIIIYGHRVVFNREGEAGTYVCSNCGHTCRHTLCRQVNQGTLFYIPIIRTEKQRGIMCESCGNIVPLDKQEYKNRKNQVNGI